MRPAPSVVGAARSSAGSFSPPFLPWAGPGAAALGQAGSPGLAVRALAPRPLVHGLEGTAALRARSYPGP